MVRKRRYGDRKSDIFSFDLQPSKLEPLLFFQVLQGYVFELSSQQWLDESIYYIKNYGEGSVIWKHWVNVWVPKDRKIDQELLDSAILFIDGGTPT